MTIARISRVIVSLASLLFAGLALALWVAPEHGAHRLGIEAVRATGLSVVRADLGGLFAGMALLCGAAAWTRGRSWIFAAVFVLAAIVLGRSIGWISTRAIGNDVVDLALELGVIAALLGIARGSRVAVVTEQRRTWRPTTVACALLIVLAGGGVTLLNPGLQQQIFAGAAQKKAATINNAPLQDDALRVAICGSSAPLPSQRRAKTCVAVFAGGQFFVVDVGPESVENLVLWGIPLSSIGGALLTHFHSDHIGDLGELNLQTWAAGRPAPLSVYGGPGVEQVVDGFNHAYRLDQGYRTAHHTDRVMPPSTWPMVPRAIELVGDATPAKDRTALVLEERGLRITAIEVDHAPIAPAYAYRFDYKGRSVLVTGDLKFHPPLITAARGVDVLVSEAISVPMTRALGTGAAAGGRDRTAAIMHDIEDYHIAPEQAAQIANDAHAKLLVFYHLLPAPDGVLARRVFAQGVDEARRGDWALADDGSLYTLPIGSEDVRVGRVIE
jgi:ribonuclease Z